MKKLITFIALLNMSCALCVSASESANSQLTDTANVNFVEDKSEGTLPFPYTGDAYIVEHFGEHKVQGLADTTINNKGVVFRTEKGAKARSVSDGVVSAVFAYAGNYTVIIRHGEYLSVYSGLENVSVKRGKKISVLHPIGEVTQDCLLSFQWRKGTKALNPEEWFSMPKNR